jgi:hypothetical protein
MCPTYGVVDACSWTTSVSTPLWLRNRSRIVEPMFRHSSDASAERVTRPIAREPLIPSHVKTHAKSRSLLISKRAPDGAVFNPPDCARYYQPILRVLEQSVQTLFGACAHRCATNAATTSIAQIKLLVTRFSWRIARDIGQCARHTTLG